MRIILLGPVEAFADDATPMEISGVRLRMLLARLALEAGRPVSADSLIDDLWGEEAPSGATSALQGLVSRLRKALAGAATLDLVAGGYRLSVRAEDVDVHRFEELAGQGRRELAAGRPKEAAAMLGAALGLWRGAALADVLEAPFARPTATKLDNVRAAAAEDRFEAELRLGRHAEVLADLSTAGAAHPLSERLAELRMRALAAAGRQSDALAVYEEIRGRLGEELGVDPSAELQQVHLALLRGELERSSPQAEQAAPSRLPARLTSFVGRESELDQLAELMAASRLVTIVGPGGAGKTRLSLEAAIRDRAYPRGRVWLVPLAGVSAPDQLADAVLGALSASDGRLYDGSQQAAPVDRMAELLDVGDAVLLLDNCEHLVEAAAELADQLLERLPQLRILATSREPLAITGEALCHLGPLEVPQGSPDPTEAAEAAAVRLFVDRAAGVRPGFALDDSTVDAVVEICWRLDGMPLALELAAARLRSMSVEQIARRLDDRFRLLTSGSRIALPRQRTLLAVVEWSWDLLDEPERVLARRLSAFPGGATLAALEAVCADGSLPAEDVLYVLGSLVEKSIVQQADDRYRMLETIRAYAASRLAASGDDVSTGFADYFLALAEEHEPLLRTRAQLEAIALFDAEHDNMVFALRAVLNAGDALRASRFARAMFWYWGIRGMSTQFQTYLTEVLAFGDALPDQARAAFRVVRLAAAKSASPAEPADVDPAGAMEFHPALPLLRMSQLAGNLEEGPLQQALNSPDPWVRASAHWAQDFVLTEQGDLQTGVHSRREALRGFEEVGDRWGLVMSLLPLGRDHSLRGEYGQAIAAFERAVAIASELGTEEHLYYTKAALAAVRRRSGDFDGALRDILAAQRQARERGHRRLETDMLGYLSGVHRCSGDIEQADQVLDRMEALVHRLPYPEEMARDLVSGYRMANRLAEGAPEQARELLPRAVRGLFAYGNANGVAWAAELLARLLELEEDPVGAAHALGMSHVIRGAFYHGDPDLRELAARLTERLGEDGYREAYRRGAELPRQDALNRLAEISGQPVGS
ncbi:BTAD domain-containing putative transcriptional regulator [Streptosporangium sp. NPDC000396]|uniref:BTAD domain-containing putative transcriptional regulator n=1 Tax=Streptosporangium sp. NPDC000396 TaxID=3366185 RepID=UPI00368EDEC1